MDLKAMDILTVLAKSGSIRQTAEIMGVSPTAVTRQLDKLEHHFNVTLLKRTPRGVVLTAAGEILASKATVIARELEQAQQTIDDLKGLNRGSVSMYVNGAASSAIIAPALADFSRQYPNVTIDVTVASASQSREAVASGATDIAVTMFSQPDARIATRFQIPVRHEPIMAPGHPLADRSAITMAQIVKYPMAIPDLSFGVRRAFDARLRKAGIEAISPAFTTSSLELQKELARRDSAVLILPEMTVAREIEKGSLVMRPFVPRERIETLLQLNHSVARQQSFAARMLLEFLEKFLRDGFGASEL